MYQELTFPGLGLSFNLNRVAFHMPAFLGGFAIYWYGIIIATAFLIGSAFVIRRVKTFGLDSDRAFDVILAGIVGAIIGARLYYVIFTWSSIGYNSLWDIIYTRGGGLGIYGGIIVAVVFAVVMCKIRRVKTLPMMDLAAGALILGQAIGRWANFINIEAFGSNTSLPWGMQGPSITNYLLSQQAALSAMGISVDPYAPVHPTFFYESLWCLAGFLLILFFTKHRRFDGQLTLIYLAWYGAGRFWIEGLRTDSLMLGNVRISQLLAALCVITSVIILIAVFSKIKRESDSEYLKLYVDTEEGKSVLAGTFYTKPSIEEICKENPADSEQKTEPNDSAQDEEIASDISTIDDGNEPQTQDSQDTNDDKDSQDTTED